MDYLLHLARFLLIIECLGANAVNSEAGHKNDRSKSKIPQSYQQPQNEFENGARRGNDNSLEPPRFQKKGDPSGASHTPSTVNKSPSEPSKSSEEALTSAQRPSNEETKAKEVSFASVLFDAEVDKAKLKGNYEVPMDIKLKDDCADGVKFSFKDTKTKDIAEHFEAKCDSTDKKKIHMKLVKDFDDNVLSKLGFITLILQGEDKDAKVLSETVAWIKLITKSKGEEKLAFEKPKYEVESLFEYEGVVEQCRAKMVNDQNAIIKYSIISSDAGIKNSVTIDTYTGALRVKKPPQPGQYQIKIQAQTADEKYKDSADVTLAIKYTTVCNDKGLSFVHSLKVVKIPQGKDKKDFVNLNKQQDNCVYKMASQKPAGDYFDLDEKIGSLSLKKGVFRSDQIFSGEKGEPKFVLELKIDCKAEKPASNRKQSATKPEDKSQKSNEDAQTDDDILNDPKKLIIDVLIDDDGPLVFPEAESFVGYPQSYDFIEEVLPPSLITVQVDRKNLRNDADIRYEIEEKDCPFTIHPTSGKVYPCAFHKDSDTLTFTVIAKRMNKEKVVTEAKTKVTVFFLTLKQIVQIDLTDVDMANIDSPLQHLKVESDLILKELFHAVLPKELAKDKAAVKGNAETTKHFIRVYGYGFDTKKHAIVDGDVISDKLKSSSNVADIQVIQTDSPKTPDKSGYGFWSSGLLICSVVIILIFGVFGSYLIYARNRPVPFGLMRARHHDHTSVTPLEDDVEGPSRTSWINVRSNPFTKSNKTHSNGRPPYTDFRTRNVAFSFNTADATLDSTNNYRDIPTPQLGNLSSFKPDGQDDRDTPLNVINLQSGTTYGTLTQPETSETPNAEVQNNNVPVLPVVMLPPVSIDRNRKNRLVSTETRGENANDTGMSSKNQ